MTKKFFKAAAIRALWTVCETAVAMIGPAIFMEEVNWPLVGSAAALAGILALLKSIVVGLPEVTD